MIDVYEQTFEANNINDLCNIIYRCNKQDFKIDINYLHDESIPVREKYDLCIELLMSGLKLLNNNEPLNIPNIQMSEFEFIQKKLLNVCINMTLDVKDIDDSFIASDMKQFLDTKHKEVYGKDVDADNVYIVKCIPSPNLENIIDNYSYKIFIHNTFMYDIKFNILPFFFV